MRKRYFYVNLWELDALLFRQQKLYLKWNLVSVAVLHYSYIK